MAPNSKRRKSKLSRLKQETDLNGRTHSEPVDALAVHLAQLPKSELGATWLDKFGEKILTIQFNKEMRKRLAEEGQAHCTTGKSYQQQPNEG